jgi:sec-independent protein translocase protein TatA
MFGLGWPELVIVLVIILVIFGPKRLPQLGKSLGQTIRAIRKGSETADEEEEGPAADKAETAKKEAPPEDEEE